MNPKEKAEQLKQSMGTQLALTLAESCYKGCAGGKNNWSLSDLPDYSRIANDVEVGEQVKKNLFKMEARKAKEVEKLKGYWSNVAGILRKQAKA